MICPICHSDLGNSWPKTCPYCECILREDPKSNKKHVFAAIAIAAIILISSVVLCIPSRAQTDGGTIASNDDFKIDGDFSTGILRYFTDDNGALVIWLDKPYRNDTVFYKWSVFDLNNDKQLYLDTKNDANIEWNNPIPGHYKIIVRVGADATSMKTYSGTIEF